MISNRRRLLAAGAGVAGALALAPSAWSQSKRKLRFGVGPLLPTPEDTKKAYTPLFAHLAQQLGADFDLVATTDWAGMAVAMGSGQLDLAWMGPWGYVLAASSTGCTALATVKYDDKPIYHAIIVGKPGLESREVPRRHEGPDDLVRRRRLDVGLAHPDLVRERSVEDRPEDVLEVLRRRDPRGE